MKIGRHVALLTIAVAGCAIAACSISDTKAPPLQGPSTLGLALVLAATPDVISLDGASQSQITIDARGPEGQPLPNTLLRIETVVNNTVVDYGTLSARTLTTGTNGRATLTYTAPNPVAGAANASVVSIRATPTGTDAANQSGRYVDIRLVPPGVIQVPGPTPLFSYFPAAPIAFEDVTFISASTASVGTIIASTSWAFGDGTTASGSTVTHRFAGGTYTVTLTVTDSNGVSAQVPQSILVGAGRPPTALFTFSPSVGNVTGKEIFFNASASTPGLGHRIVRYDWDFGTSATASGVTVTNTYTAPGSYTVTLIVTDEGGQRGVQSTTLVVAAAAEPVVTAQFTSNPSSTNAGGTVTFDGVTSSTTSGSITRYDWNFGDGSPVVETLAPITSTSHRFNTAGTFNVTLAAFDTNGKLGTVSHTIIVAP